MSTEIEIIDNQLSNPNKIKNELINDSNVLSIANQIDYKDQISLIEFGKESADSISSFSDKILATIKSSSMEESSTLLRQLGKLMDKFDKDDFKEDKGFLSKLFNKGEKMIEKLFVKYNSMGAEIDKIYIEIKKYEHEMKTSTLTLEQLYNENYDYYFELEKYIVAGQIKTEELKNNIPALQEKVNNGDQFASMELNTLNNAIELLEQRVYDLEMAKQVAFQSAPQIRMLQRGNTKLIGKINSAFVVTIPIFKTGLINAIAAKKQNLVAQSMDELDRRTNELLIKNAQNIADQSVNITRLSGQSSIKAETLEQSWNIIMNGLNETKQIEEENKRLREEGRKKIQDIQNNFKQIQHL